MPYNYNTYAQGRIRAVKGEYNNIEKIYRRLCIGYRHHGGQCFGELPHHQHAF